MIINEGNRMTKDDLMLEKADISLVIKRPEYNILSNNYTCTHDWLPWLIESHSQWQIIGCRLCGRVTMCKDIHREIVNQQSEEMKEIE